MSPEVTSGIPPNGRKCVVVASTTRPPRAAASSPSARRSVDLPPLPMTATQRTPPEEMRPPTDESSESRQFIRQPNL